MFKWLKDPFLKGLSLGLFLSFISVVFFPKLWITIMSKAGTEKILEEVLFKGSKDDLLNKLNKCTEETKMLSDEKSRCAKEKELLESRYVSLEKDANDLSTKIKETNDSWTRIFIKYQGIYEILAVLNKGSMGKQEFDNLYLSMVNKYCCDQCLLSEEINMCKSLYVDNLYPWLYKLNFLQHKTTKTKDIVELTEAGKLLLK